MKSKIILLILIFTSLIMGLVVGCGKIQNEAANISNLSKIEITPQEITLAPNGFQQFSVIPYDSNNNVLTGESYTVNWSVSGDIGNITNNGILTAKNAGNGQVIASIGNISGSANITVIAAPPPQDFRLNNTGEILIPEKNINISWGAANSSVGIKKYQILAYRVGGGADDYGVLMNGINPTLTATTCSLPVDGIWKIKVRAIDNNDLWRDTDGTSAAGDSGDVMRILSVNCDSTPPGPLTLNYPYDGQYFDQRNVAIAWFLAYERNLDHYEIIIGSNQYNMQGSAVYSAVFPANVTSCEVNLPGGIYYIYLIAYDKAGHYRNLKNKTDIPSFDLAPGTIFSGEWPSFEID